MMTEHLDCDTKLFMSVGAVVTMPTRKVVVHADSRAHRDIRDEGPSLLNHSGDLMAERHGQGMDPRKPGTIMNIGMADSRSADPYEDLLLTDLRDWDLLGFQGLSHLNQANRSH